MTRTIPAHVVEDVREGLFCLLGATAEAMLRTLETPRRECHPEWFLDDRRRLQHALGLLDLVGWSARQQVREVEVESAQQWTTVLEAVQGYIPLLEDRREDLQPHPHRGTAGGQDTSEELTGRIIALRELLAG